MTQITAEEAQRRGQPQNRETATSAASSDNAQHQAHVSDPSQGAQGSERSGSGWSSYIDTGTQSLGLAASATSFGIGTAKFWTKFGIEIGRHATQLGLAIPAIAFDAASSSAERPLNGPAASGVRTAVGALFDGISLLALGSIDVGGQIAGASLGAASTGLGNLGAALESDLAQSLSSIARLVHRNWAHEDESLPPGGLPPYSLVQVTRALTAWVGIQQVTRQFSEKRVLSGVTELPIEQLIKEVDGLKKKESETRTAQSASNASSSADAPRIVDETTIPDNGGDVISAEIGHTEVESTEPIALANPALDEAPDSVLPPAQAVLAFERYSKLVLGIYGGAALRMWGVKVPSAVAEQAATAATATVSPTTALRASAAETASDPVHLATSHEQELQDDEADFLLAAAHLNDESVPGLPGSWIPEEPSVSAEPATIVAEPESIQSDTGAPTTATSETPVQSATAPPVVQAERQPTLIDLFSGRHDDDVFHRYSGVKRGTAEAGLYTSVSSQPTGRPVPSRPKYYIVTDHDAKKVVLVLRGTLSLGDIAADLTCDSVPFENMNVDAPSAVPPNIEDHPASRGQYHDDDDAYLVHEGMFITALSIGGSRTAPVHKAVARALRKNPTYDLDITGHSLGAGLASLLALLWVGLPDPVPSGSGEFLGRISKESGLPSGRRLHAYCFAPPATMSAPLGRRCSSFISCWSHSWDIVPRLSLGTILDIRNACAWLAYEEDKGKNKQAAPTEAVLDETMPTASQEVTEELQTSKDSHDLAHDVDAAIAAVSEDSTAERVLASENATAQTNLEVGSEEAAPKPEPTEPDSASTAQQSSRDADIGQKPPFELNTLIKQAFGHVASAPSASSSSGGSSQATSILGSLMGSRSPEARQQTEEVFWALRRNLEANMKHVELYPPGSVLLTFNDGDLLSPPGYTGSGKRRLFKLEDDGKKGKGVRDDVFGQIEFRKGFLSRHLPHSYHDALADLLAASK